MNAIDPMQTLIAGMFLGWLDRMRDTIAIREFRKIGPTSFELVLGSLKVLRVEVQLLPPEGVER